MRPKLIAAVVGAAALAIGAAGAYGSGGIKTHVEITQSGTSEEFFEGTVSSKNDQCEKGRKIVLFYAAPGSQTFGVVGHTVTRPDGDWDVTGEFQNGLYYAKAKAKQLDSHTFCDVGSTKPAPY